MLTFNAEGGLVLGDLEVGDEFHHVRSNQWISANIRKFRVEEVYDDIIVCVQYGKNERTRLIRSSKVRGCYAPNDPILVEIAKAVRNQNAIKRISTLAERINPIHANRVVLDEIENLLAKQVEQQDNQESPAWVQKMTEQPREEVAA